MNNEPIKEVSSYKHLGTSICLSSDETWHEHINYITAKALIRVNVMRNLKFLLDRRSLEMIYEGQSKSSWTLSIALASFECL